LFRFFDRQAHNIGIGTAPAGDDETGFLLDGIGASLVEGINQGKITIDGGLVQRLEGHVAGRLGPEGQPVAVAPEGEAGVYRVRPAGQAPEHRSRLVKVARLVEHDAIDANGGIGAENQGFGAAGSHPVGLERGVVPHHLAGIGVGRLELRNIGVHHFERHTQAGQQLPSSGRGGGEDQHGWRVRHESGSPRHPVRPCITPHPGRPSLRWAQPRSDRRGAEISRTNTEAGCKRKSMR